MTINWVQFELCVHLVCSELIFTCVFHSLLDSQSQTALPCLVVWARILNLYSSIPCQEILGLNYLNSLLIILIVAMWIHEKRLHLVPYTILLSHQAEYVGKISFQWWASVTGAPDALCRVTLDAV